MRTKGAMGKMNKMKLSDMSKAIKSSGSGIKKISMGAPKIKSFGKSFFRRAARKSF